MLPLFREYSVLMTGKPGRMVRLVDVEIPNLLLQCKLWLAELVTLLRFGIKSCLMDSNGTIVACSLKYLDVLFSVAEKTWNIVTVVPLVVRFF